MPHFIIACWRTIRTILLGVNEFKDLLSCLSAFFPLVHIAESDGYECVCVTSYTHSLHSAVHSFTHIFLRALLRAIK